MLRIKRIYEEASSDDGYRVLVDRLWPSNHVRKAFNHEPEKYDDFIKAYTSELDKNRESKEIIDFLNLIKDKLREGNVTLLFGAKNKEMNQAVVLKEWIEKN